MQLVQWEPTLLIIQVGGPPTATSQEACKMCRPLVMVMSLSHHASRPRISSISPLGLIRSEPAMLFLQAVRTSVPHSPAFLFHSPGHTRPATATASPTVTWSEPCPRERSGVSTRLCRKLLCSCWAWRADFDGAAWTRLQPFGVPGFVREKRMLFVDWGISHVLINGSVLGLSENKGSLLRNC